MSSRHPNLIILDGHKSFQEITAGDTDSIVVEDAVAHIRPQTVQLEAISHSTSAAIAAITMEGTGTVGTPAIVKHPNDNPPKHGEHLLWYLPGKDRYEIIDHLDELYRKAYHRHGRRAANRLYYTHVLLSFWPYIKQLAYKLAAGGWIADIIRRLTD